MFLVRSAFWLTVAFVAFHPHDVDLGPAATSLSDQAMAAGQKIIVDELLKNPCAVANCPATEPAPRQVAQIAPRPVAPVEPRAAIAPETAPIPMPRPAWMS